MIRLARKWNLKSKLKEVRRNGRGERRERGREGRRKDKINRILFNFPSEIQNTELFFFLDVHPFWSNCASHTINFLPSSALFIYFWMFYFVFSNHVCLLLIRFSFTISSSLHFPAGSIFPSELQTILRFPLTLIVFLPLLFHSHWL